MLRTHTKQEWAWRFLFDEMRFIDCLWSDFKVSIQKWVYLFLVVWLDASCFLRYGLHDANCFWSNSKSD